MNPNTIVIAGNLTADPELAYGTTGTARATFTVAVAGWAPRGTEAPVSFFDAICWKDLAEHVAESLHKGDRVVVTGRLDQQRWTTPEGQKRFKVQLIAEDVGPSLMWATATVQRAQRSEPVAATAGGDEPF